MTIKISQPYGFSQIGKRINNEDAIFPAVDDATIHSSLFLVCDGMGGHSNGEIASNLVIDKLSDYYETRKYSFNNINEIMFFWDNAIIEIEEQFEQYMLKNPESKGMGTTLCLLQFHENYIITGHIGDSRIYQIRNNQIIFMTEDHSMVNTLLKAGKLTPSEALNYPNRNVITRAIQGRLQPTQIEYNHINDIQTGDYFFICTDGILEQINDRILIDIVMLEGSTLKEKVDILLRQCQGLTKDNYSGYLIEVTKGNSHYQVPQVKHLIDEVLTSKQDNTELGIEKYNNYYVFPTQTLKSKSNFSKRFKDIIMGFLYGFIGLVFIFAVYTTLDSFKDNTRKVSNNQSKARVSLQKHQLSIIPPSINNEPKVSKDNKTKKQKSRDKYISHRSDPNFGKSIKDSLLDKVSDTVTKKDREPKIL